MGIPAESLANRQDRDMTVLTASLRMFVKKFSGVSHGD